MMDADRLQRLEDHFALQVLLTSYARACDDRDWVRYRTLFTENAMIDYTGALGRKGLRDDIAEWLEQIMNMPNLQHARHLLGNFEVNVSKDTAAGRADYLNPDVFNESNTRFIAMNGGVYEFKALRSGLKWLISELSARIIWSGKIESYLMLEPFG